jgi:hypothetical protein
MFAGAFWIRLGTKRATIIHGKSRSGIHTLQGFQELMMLGLAAMELAAGCGCESLMITFPR